MDADTNGKSAKVAGNGSNGDFRAAFYSSQTDITQLLAIAARRLGTLNLIRFGVPVV